MNAPTEQLDPLVEALQNSPVDAEIRNAIRRFGAEAVKASIKRLTKPKRGRKPDLDWPELCPVIDADARNWLSGGDPFAVRSNYSIAKAFADGKPVHNHPANMKRIERKLAINRVRMTQYAAYELSLDGYPHATHVRAVEELVRAGSHPVWQTILENAKSKIAEYGTALGQPPPARLSMKEVEDAVHAALSPTPTLGGLLGLGSLFPASAAVTGSKNTLKLILDGSKGRSD